MSNNSTEDDIIRNVADMSVADMETDYTGLLHIAGRVRLVSGRTNNVEVKRLSLCVVRAILLRGLRPGDYLETGLQFWKESPQEALTRIDREWNPAEGDPTLVKPICWFGQSKN